MNHLGKPDAGNLPVRFEEGDGDGMGRTIPTLLKNCIFELHDSVGAPSTLP
jgi:hypothetical protein